MRKKKKMYSECPIVVYQMGKVGSGSITQTLIASGYDAYHVHHLLEANIEGVKSQLSSKGLDLPPELTTIPKIIKKNLLSSVTNRFVTLVRDPIARNISAFFHNLHILTSMPNSNEILDVKELIDVFLTQYSHEIPLNWFDNELKTVLGIDIYQYPFPKNIGYLEINFKNIHLLIMKVEISDEVKVNALSNFLGGSPIKFRSSNIAEDKYYNDIYKLFQANIKLPTDYIDTMLNSKFTNYFYTDKEINRFRLKWYKH
jgi:hypothetical protein